MLEKTLILVKPGHVEFAGEILKQLDFRGNRITTARIGSVQRSMIEDHYFPHKDKSFFGYMCDSFVNRSIVLAVYQGRGIIQKFIKIIGPTDPSKAPKHTIRGKYSNDSLERSIAEKRPVENVIHRSDSIEEARREISVWEIYLNQ